MNALFLGVDQGTHSSRALLFDNQGNEVASAYEAVDLKRLRGGRVEQDAGQLVDSVKKVIEKIFRTRNDASNVAACGIATQRSTVLSWTDVGVANGSVLSWQDVRGGDLVESLLSHEADIREISGLPLSAHYGASKMRWLFDNLHESSFAKGDRLSPLVSFLLYRLLENKPYLVDHSNAQRTQLMDINTLDWSDRLTQWFGVPDQMLPACMPMCADYGVLSESGVPVTAVCGDQNAAMFGVGQMLESTALVNLGSGAFILRTLPQYKSCANQLSGIAYSDNKTVQYVREATINGAGSALSWLEKKYNINDIVENLSDWLETVDEPPLFINTVGGLGSPWWRQDVQPYFIDADLNNEGALVVAVIESIIFMVRANLDLIIKELPLKKLRVSGGLSKSDGLCQKLSNLCGLPVERSDNSEATAKGVAWLAAGRPSSWMSGDVAESFMPVKDETLKQRYSMYVAELNHKLEMSA
jgi:glycerol kinase